MFIGAFLLVGLNSAFTSSGTGFHSGANYRKGGEKSEKISGGL